MRQRRRRERLLVASNPDVVRDAAKSLVASINVEDGAKLVLEIIPASSFKSDTINIKPSTPERPGKPADVAVHKTASEVAEGKVNM
ncbi:hypothetical protein HYQ46_005076 [Verticillium longisporum]|nr:hypothetical protein HYQ46_005076 [Verticillium longisporum]